MRDYKVNIKAIFRSLQEKEYVIVKMPENFPAYLEGSDIDIFCYNSKDIIDTVLFEVQSYIDEELNVKIQDLNGQVYLDIIKNHKIHLRFDIYEELPTYQNVVIKPAYFESIIENAIEKKCEDIRIKIPCEIDENLIRLIEYYEWYSERPDKVKHVKYIENSILQRNITTSKLFDKLHHYIEIPPVSKSKANKKSRRSRKKIGNLISKALMSIKSDGITNTLKKVYKKLFSKPE